MKKILFFVILITTILSCRKNNLSGEKKIVLEKGVYIVKNFGQILYTKDMKSFSEITHSAPVMLGINVHYKEGKLYSFSTNPYYRYCVSISEDGKTWNTISITDKYPHLSFARESSEMVFYFNGRFCSFMNTEDSVAVSNDGITWKAYPPIANAKPRSGESYYVRNDTLFMAGGVFYERSTNTFENLSEVWMTKDGWNWKKLSSQSVSSGYWIEETTMHPINGVTYAVGKSTSFGMKAKLFASTDGIKWNVIDENPPYAYVDGRRYNMTIISYNKKVFFFKGFSDENQLPYKDIWSFDGQGYQKEFDITHVEVPFFLNDGLPGSIVVVN